MSGTAEERVKNLETQLEVKQDELAGTETNLQTQIELTQKEIARLEQALKEAQWQEKLERVEKQLVQLYREERKQEDKINGDVNALFHKTAKIVEKMNRGFKDLEELRGKRSDIERGLIKGSQDRQMRDAIEFKKAEVIREVGVTEQLEGGTSLIRTVNVELGIQESEELGKAVIRLPIYARNIYEEVRRAGGRPLRTRWDELIRVARIPEPRIIRAREELNKNLEVLREKGRIVYEEEGDSLIIREMIKEEVSS
ncbi:hypothetical protein MYX84_04040 [Acidobacteria bacterium AH-259-O06]|nr:hypothetical protein [Acidobacteria bacterium AH-259-O06]